MISTVKRLAADILGVGVSKIRIKPEELSRAEGALTREDVRSLIKDKVIYISKSKRKRVSKARKKRKAKRGVGRRKGTKASRKSPKEKWMELVRSQREYLNKLISEGHVDKKYKREIYLRIKGGSFKGKKALLNYLKENEIYQEKKVSK